MATKAQLLARASALNVTVDIRKDNLGLEGSNPRRWEHEITLEAPAGMVLAGAGVHGTVVRGDAQEGERGTPWAKLYADAIEDMRFGVEPCDEVDCDCCAEQAE